MSLLVVFEVAVAAAVIVFAVVITAIICVSSCCCCTTSNRIVTIEIFDYVSDTADIYPSTCNSLLFENVIVFFWGGAIVVIVVAVSIKKGSMLSHDEEV